MEHHLEKTKSLLLHVVIDMPMSIYLKDALNTPPFPHSIATEKAGYRKSLYFQLQEVTKLVPHSFDI